MAFDTPTLDETHQFLIALFGNLLTNPDTSQGSFNWLWLKTQAAAVTDNHAHIDATKNDLLPDTAPDDGMLDRWGTIRGVVRTTATPARKEGALRVFGTPLAVVPDLQQLNHASGLRFQTNNSSIVGPGGYVDMDVVAIDTGSQTRLQAGEDLNFAATPAGLVTTAVLQLDMDEDGTDLEDPGAYRARILSRFSSPPLGGTQTDYVQWALSVTGLVAAFCYPLRQGFGSVDLAALHTGTGTVRMMTAPEVASLQALIDQTLRPVSVRAFRVLQVTTNAIDVELMITPDGQPQNAFDWDDSVAPLVAGWNAGTRVLTFNARPASIAPGHRMSIKVTPSPNQGGAQRTVQALGPGGNDVTLEVNPNVADPVVGATVYAGGPLVDPCRAAMIALFDSLGTANPDSHRYGSWEGNLRLGGIARVINVLPGVLDNTPVTPVVTVQANDPAYPGDAFIELLIPGRILIRMVH